MKRHKLNKQDYFLKYKKLIYENGIIELLETINQTSKKGIILTSMIPYKQLLFGIFFIIHHNEYIRSIKPHIA